MSSKPEDFEPDSYVMVTAPSIITRRVLGAHRIRVQRGEILWLIAPIAPESNIFARVRCKSGYVGDIRREYIRPLTMLEAIGSALEEDRSVPD